jgi:S1-C subfamily serine protease
MGTAWAIDLKNGMDKKNPTTLITNHHVIEECIGGKGKLTVAELFKKEVPAYVVKWDEENDLAVLATGLKIKPLGLSQAEPWPGYWVMALGSADGYEGSVSFGSVLNATDNEIFITANISHGNSGGPLIDNEGLVIGTTSWGKKSEQYNGAKSLNAMCEQILKCDGEFYWARD